MKPPSSPKPHDAGTGTKSTLCEGPPNVPVYLRRCNFFPLLRLKSAQVQLLAGRSNPSWMGIPKCQKDCNIDEKTVSFTLSCIDELVERDRKYHYRRNQPWLTKYCRTLLLQVATTPNPHYPLSGIRQLRGPKTLAN